jgi:shikimate kinase
MNAYNNCLSLVGMPGSGKSTLGPSLAKSLVKGFIDTDICIESQESLKLQELLIKQGYLGLRKTEENVILSLDYHNQIIATGGSAIYSAAAMQHLKSLGPIVFLDVPLAELEQRINNADTRGIARAPTQSFVDIYKERKPLYLQYADIVIDCSHKSPSDIIEEIIAQETQAYMGEDA